MEIEIQSKTDNSLLKRTEVYFMVHHEGEKTPKRELVRSELAEKLNVKKENVLVNSMQSSFGSTDTVGYAKIYKTVKEAGSNEKKHILKRNNALAGEKKEIKDETKKPEEKPKEQTEAPKEDGAKEEKDTKQEPEKPEDEKAVEKPNETPTEDKPQEEEKPQPAEEKKE